MNIAQTIKTAGKIATGLTFSAFNKDIGRRYIIGTLASLPGVTTKISQLLSLKLSTDPDEGLESPIQTLSSTEIDKLISERCPALKKNLKTISTEGIAASIGQVNKVTLVNGTVVAVKNQYPGISETIHSQLSSLFKAASFGPPKKYGLDVQEYSSYFSQSLNKELDYQVELHAQKKFLEAYKDSHNIVIPEVYSYYSTKLLLTQKWVDSCPSHEVLKWSEDQRYKACEVFLRYFLDGLLNKKMLHMDLHQKNYGFILNKETNHIALALYDFGSVLNIEPQKVQALVDIVSHFSGKKNINLIDHMIYLGFDAEKISHIKDQIPTILERLVSPLVNKAPWNPNSWDLKNHINKTLGDNKWWFRTAGPAWFLMLMRSAQGLTSFLQAQGFRYFSSKIYQKVLADYRDFSIVVPHNCALDTKSHSQSDTAPSCAKYLKIKVWDQEEELIFTTLPYHVIDDIEEYIPEKSLEDIRQTHNLREIIHRVQRSGYVAQVIFEKNLKNGKKYKVWLD